MTQKPVLLQMGWTELCVFHPARSKQPNKIDNRHIDTHAYTAETLQTIIAP